MERRQEREQNFHTTTIEIDPWETGGQAGAVPVRADERATRRAGPWAVVDGGDATGGDVMRGRRHLHFRASRPEADSQTAAEGRSAQVTVTTADNFDFLWNGHREKKRGERERGSEFGWVFRASRERASVHHTAPCDARAVCACCSVFFFLPILRDKFLMYTFDIYFRLQHNNIYVGARACAT